MAYYQLSFRGKITKVWKQKLKRKKSFSKPIGVILANILEKFRRIKALEEIYVKYKVTKLLDEVIGNDYFGTTQNRKRFYYVVNRITTQSRHECVYRSFLTKGYNIEAIPWLQHENLDEADSLKLLRNTNLFLLKNIVKPLIKHFYHPLNNHKNYGIEFVPRAKWHRFQHKVLNELLNVNFLTLATEIRPSRGQLKLFPKTNCDTFEYRPIINPQRYNSIAKSRLKRLTKLIQSLAKTFSNVAYTSLYYSWRKYCEETEGKGIYGVKLDIKDAFGYVDIDKLCSIIKESQFNSTDKQFLLNHVQYQYVTFQKKLYRWNHGLLQGDALSPSFCNLFMSDFEKERLQRFCKPGCFLHRTVDDYLFCSVSKDDVEDFENSIKNVFQVNDTKTQRTIDTNCELSYSGQIFNLQSRQVRKQYSFHKERPFRHTFKLWNIKKVIPEESKHNIITQAMKFSSNNHCFKNLELNTAFNSEETILRNYFEGMVFIAYKFDVAVMAIKEFQETASDLIFLSDILDKLVFEYSNIVYYKIQTEKCKGKFFSNNITFMLLKNIAYRAFMLVLKRRNEFYKDLIAGIKKNNLYLKMDIFDLSPKIFTTLPKVFNNICMNRHSNV